MRAAVQKAFGFNGGTEAPARRRRRAGVASAMGVGGGRATAREVRENRQRAREEQPQIGGGTRGPSIDPGFSPDFTRPPLPARAFGAAEAAGRRRSSAQDGGAAVGAAVDTGIGGQLSQRVQSGAITQDRAEQTAHERQMLEEAFGPDWRTKVFGGRGIVRANRKALAVGGEGHPQLEAFRKKLMEDRRRALERATEKLQGE